MNRFRVIALTGMAALTLAAASAVAPPARADVGAVIVQQQDAAGQMVSTQDYAVDNHARAVETGWHADACSAMSATPPSDSGRSYS